MTTPTLEAIVPTWNRAASLLRTLESLARQTAACGICVADNGSTDGTLAAVRKAHPEARVMDLRRNLGFGAAVNRAVESSSAELVVLLNNDARADERFVAELLAEQRASGAEAVAGCLLRGDGRIETLGVELDRSLLAYDAGFGGAYPDDARAAPPPLGPSGGAALFTREAFLSLGGFDEALFAYLEDAELALRLRRAGMRCALAWRAWALHEHSGTLGAGSERKNRLKGAGREYLLWKHGAGLTAPERVRGRAVDLAVYAGQALVDRNLGAVRGALAERRRLRGRERPRAGLPASVPLAERSLREALALKLARRSGPGRARRRPPARPPARPG